MLEFMEQIIDLAESRKLRVGGGGDGSDFTMFVCSEYRYGSVTNADREIFKAWLTNHSLVSGLKVGEIVDANYGV